ncbi:M42 family metallopeptidase [Mycoplasmopsis meleagridis]|uniref:M42 family metallopeptidase n=1 Tax=Mycoplasmopsis meleagridis TaxID=29561 RepID=UPI003A8685F5
MDKEIFKNKLIEYMNLEAPSRFENIVAKKIIDAVKKENFEISFDNLGSVILHKKGKNINSPRVMIAAHMDEVGYLVKNISKEGFIYLNPLGGIWTNVVVGTKAVLVNKKGERLNGIFGHTSIHIMENEKRNKALTNSDLYADFGFKNDLEAKELGIEIGDVVYMSGEVVNFHDKNLIAGKAMDNRAGVCVLEFIAKSIENLNLDIDLYLVGTVQEEVCTRGAKSAVSLINPQIAIALDTTSTHDTPLTITGTTKLGKGAALRIMDGAMMADPKLTKFLCEIALKNNIKHYKFISMGGGTNASQLQYSKGGAATITISLAQRYLHSPIGMCDINDLLAAHDLLVEFLKELNSDHYAKIIKYN